ISKELAKELENREVCREAVMKMSAQLESASNRLDPDIRDITALEGRCSDIKKYLADLTQAHEQTASRLDSAKLGKQESDTLSLTSSQEYLKALTAKADADSAFEEKLTAAGFSDVDTFRSALAESSRLKTLETELSSHAHIIDELKNRIERAVSVTADTERPNPIEIRTRLDEVRSAVKTSDTALALKKAESERLSRLCEECRAESAALAETEKRYARRLSFAKALRGDIGIGLLRYVLGMTLTDITAEANRMLSGALGGRYKLRRTLEGTGRQRKVGLELEVLDAYTGEGRPVSGLSGGEKFICSLALSLGLAAVVTRNYPGRGEEAVFIDEGFGTLDPSAVDDAMHMLAAVHGTRGTVGIISHVKALDAVIPSRIRVIASRKGSTIV
nr:hypothetical protein [Clostridia bacterium]